LLGTSPDTEVSAKMAGRIGPERRNSAGWASPPSVTGGAGAAEAPGVETSGRCPGRGRDRVRLAQGPDADPGPLDREGPGFNLPFGMLLKALVWTLDSWTDWAVGAALGDTPTPAGHPTFCDRRHLNGLASREVV
jgi:hypothetical protein